MNNAFTKTLLASALLAASVSAMAAFAPNMGAAALAAEVKAQKQDNKTAQQIASAALATVGAANVGLLADAMLSQGLPASDVISSLISVFGASESVVKAVVASAKAANVPTALIQSAALSGGAPTDLVTTATAAGQGQGQGQQGQGVGNSVSNFAQSTNRPSFANGGGSVSRN